MLINFFRQNKQIFIILLAFGVTLLAQVFIPFGFWGRYSQLSVSPNGTVYMNTESIRTFTASGGTGSYSWGITTAAFTDVIAAAGIGPLAAQTDTTNPTDYLSRGTSYQSDTITLTSGGVSTTVTVITYDPMSLSPTTVSLAVSTTQQFTNVNGYCTGVPGSCTNATTTWTIVSGTGSISSTGLFTAPGTAGTTIIQAADSIGSTAQATITISSSLQISPSTIKVPVYSTVQYSAILGTVPYTYSITSGGGTIGCASTLTGAHTNTVTTFNVTNNTNCPAQGKLRVSTEIVYYYGLNGATQFTGVVRGANGTTAVAYVAGQTYNSNLAVYTAPSTTGSATVRVTDNVAATSDSTVTIIRPVEIVSTYTAVCARYNEGSVKCWGENSHGELGIGSTTNTHTYKTDLKTGNEINYVSLGTGRTATSLAAGWYHVCALLDNSTVKCWGYNIAGQLGDGTTTQRTDPSVLSAINFGAKTPNAVWAFGHSSCAGFTDNTAVCWGLNTSGQLGQGNTSVTNTPPSTMINFGGVLYPTKIVGAVDFACALLNDSSVKCWGLNTNGEIGDGTTTQRTSPVSVTLGGTAIDVAAGVGGGTGSAPATPYSGHACAVLTGNIIKCWGYNVAGQLGDATAVNKSSPTSTTALGFSPTKVHAGRNTTCATILNSYQTKCWGDSRRGLNLNAATTPVVNTAAVCSTTLTGAHTAIVTTITVGTTAYCPHPTAGTTSPGMIRVGTEIICFTGKTATTFTGATRGCYGTTAAAYAGGVAVNGYMYFGIGIGSAQMAFMGRHNCILTGGGVANNDRIKCWGISTNQGRSAIVGQLLNFSAITTGTYIGDATTELGDNLPYLYP